MSFWSGLGKVLLKAAPIAAMAIPGIGVPLGMAISGATGAASKKLSGGSWKSALLSGGIDAGLAGIGGGAVKGLGPSAGAVGKATGETAKTGVKSVLGNIGKSVGKNVLGNVVKSGLPGSGGIIEENPQSGPGWKDILGDVLNRGKSYMEENGSQGINAGINQGSNRVPPVAAQSAVPRGLGPTMPRGGYSYEENPMNQLDQSNPNLAQSIFQGRQEALNRRRPLQVATY